MELELAEKEITYFLLPMKQYNKPLIVLSVIAGLLMVIFVISRLGDGVVIPVGNRDESITENEVEKTPEVETQALHPMAIESLRKNEYPGGDFVIEKQLANGSNYKQYIASYQSEGLKIFGLLTVPIAEKTENGFPAILFIHGYIPPKQYSTTGNYPTYLARLARSGFVTFKPDLRGHGNSEGEPVSGHYSEKYVVDTLNALSYLKKYAEVDPKRIGYWGHSNGGEIGLRVLVTSPDIRAASLWA